MSSIRAKMPQSQRAKQFAPFDAVVGLRAALKEKERIREPRRILSEDMAEALDRKLRALMRGDVVTVVYYDAALQEYVQLTGTLCRMDTVKRRMQLEETEIGFDDIYEIFR